MISPTLLAQTVRSNAGLWFVFTAVQAFCLGAMVGVGGTLAMTGQAYYNLLPGVLTGIYAVVVSNRLLAAQVGSGSMAYVLATPVSRAQVALTQALFLVVSLVLMAAVSTAAHAIAAVAAFGALGEGELGTIVALNAGVLCLALAFAGVCFASSAASNLSKYALGVGGGFVGLMLLLALFGMFGGTLADLARFTIVRLYDVAAILAGDGGYAGKLAVLAATGVVGCAGGIVAFRVRDLPL